MGVDGVDGVQADLVLFGLGGVQRFLRESRTTADVAGASIVVQELSRRAAALAGERLAGLPRPYGLIVPAPAGQSAASHGTTNKVAFLAPVGQGRTVAGEVAGAVELAWAERVKRAFPGGQETPGMPDLSWVCVTGSAAPEDYSELWERARAALVARRRVRVFTPLLRKGRTLCSQSPQLPATVPPAGRRRHEQGEHLSAAGWVKRLETRHGDTAFPSTVAIASSSFRARLIAVGAQAPSEELATAVGRLSAIAQQLDAPRERGLRVGEVPAALRPLADGLGAWVFPERWDAEAMARAGVEARPSVVAKGRAEAVALVTLARRLGVPPPTPYFAVVAQDLDRLGQKLTGLTIEQHRGVSATLGGLAAAQWQAAVGLSAPAEPIYAGGDDFLAFAPAASALELAAEVRRLVAERCQGTALWPVTASTAVVFAHMGSPLQEAVEAAQSALAAAKETERDGVNRDALCVVVRRRGGERARLIQPWTAALDAVTLLRQVRPASPDGPLSPGLASRLEADESSLDELARDGLRPVLSKELQRLVARQHGGSPEAAERVARALGELGRRERSAPLTPFSAAVPEFRPVPAALTARFLTQECR
jgi:hypothetical protein